MSLLGRAALAYVDGAALGAPAAVFPLIEGGKRPHPGLGGSGGLYQASFDADQVAAWWRFWPEANIGLPTARWPTLDVEGPSKGHAVVDVLERLDAAGLERPPTRVNETAGEGRHLIYRTPPDAEVRGRKLLDGAEVKGKGGYVVAPPSVVDGVRYTILDAQPPTPVPPWLLVPPTRPKLSLRSRELGGRPYTTYGWAALRALLARLRNVAEPDHRHTSIYAAAAQFGRLERAGHVDGQEFRRVSAVAHALFPAPRDPADERGIVRALERGREAGWAEP